MAYGVISRQQRCQTSSRTRRHPALDLAASCCTDFGEADQLHHVVQAAMGWLDRHLWMLRAGDRSYAVLIPGEDDWNERVDDAETTTLATILSGGLKEFGYLYDFGDSWQHRIIVENVKPAEQQTPYPEFLGGERRCPPEDCGGIPGYYDFLDKIATKREKNAKQHSTGMVDLTIPMTSMNSGSSST
jgi:Plasmid pRiA4b ORF-3-like protein